MVRQRTSGVFGSVAR
uniref:Uncharacterized protein n=1 Tax=Anopheles quadriannulatus TaxID=34691 RepID=A0A182XRC9_ANOQN